MWGKEVDWHQLLALRESLTLANTVVLKTPQEQPALHGVLKTAVSVLCSLPVGYKELSATADKLLSFRL